MLFKQKHTGCKSNKKQPYLYVQPKAAKQLRPRGHNKDVSNYLNDIQYSIVYFHKYDWLCHLATCTLANWCQGGQVMKNHPLGQLVQSYLCMPYMCRSFGVLVWEVATFVDTPHHKLKAADIIEMANNGNLKLNR